MKAKEFALKLGLTEEEFDRLQERTPDAVAVWSNDTKTDESVALFCRRRDLKVLLARLRMDDSEDGDEA